jgi:glycosyltransferase involved in cell wall biosynthesis
MPELNMGGAERVITHIMNGIDRDIFDIELILFNNQGQLIGSLKSDIKIHQLNHASVKRGLFPLLRKIYQLRPNIVFSGIGHLNISLAPFIPIFNHLLPQTRWIARQTSILTLNNQKEKSPKLYNWLYKKVYKNYHKIICQSQYMQQDLLDNYHFPKEKSIVINNPVDTIQIEQDSLERLAYPFDTDKINLLSVGQLRPEKGQESLLKAFSKLDNIYSLTIIGEGEEQSRLESLMEELGLQNRVRFIGYQANPYAYMKRADMLILSSEYEGFPNVVLEAGICGLPVVSYQCAGGVEEIIKEGINGFLVRYRDINALSFTINKATDYPFDLGEIREMMVQKYGMGTIIKKYQTILKEDNHYE